MKQNIRFFLKRLLGWNLKILSEILKNISQSHFSTCQDQKERRRE